MCPFRNRQVSKVSQKNLIAYTYKNNLKTIESVEASCMEFNGGSGKTNKYRTPNQFPGNHQQLCPLTCSTAGSRFCSRSLDFPFSRKKTSYIVLTKTLPVALGIERQIRITRLCQFSRQKENPTHLKMPLAFTIPQSKWMWNKHLVKS